MLNKKATLIVLLSSILLATNTPSVNANHVYKEGTKENQLILNYNKQINNQNKYIKYLNSLNQSLKQETIEWHKGLERERLEKIKQEEQKKNNGENNNIDNNAGKINFVCSFYSGDSSENGGQILTASGQQLREGIVASNNFKFDTKIHIDKLGDYEVQDTGNPNYIKQIDNNTYKIDVYINSKEEAERLGIIKSTGYIIK